MKEATLQDVFNVCATHLMTQKAKSSPYGNSSRGCVYYYTNAAGEELRCGAQPVLDDSKKEEIISTYNDQSIYNILKNTATHTLISPKFRHLIGGHFNALMEDIQDCHDSIDVSEWRWKLKGIARKFNLNYDVL